MLIDFSDVDSEFSELNELFFHSLKQSSFIFFFPFFLYSYPCLFPFVSNFKFLLYLFTPFNQFAEV